VYQIILDFHLENHKTYLKPFNSLFTTAQQEGATTLGVLSETGFRSLYTQFEEKLGKKKKKKQKDAELNQLLNIVDPFSNGVIIYADVCFLFLFYGFIFNSVCVPLQMILSNTITNWLQWKRKIIYNLTVKEKSYLFIYIFKFLA
jgi:hypothetical protein